VSIYIYIDTHTAGGQACGRNYLHEAGSEAGRSPPRTQAGGKALDEALTAVGLAAPEVQQGQIVL